MKRPYLNVCVAPMEMETPCGFLTQSIVEIDSVDVTVEDYKEGFTTNSYGSSSFEVTFD